MNRSAHWENERIILLFESLWQKDGVPGLREFLDSIPNGASAEVVGELCRVDLEHRIRRGLAGDESHYLAEFPEAFRDAGLRDEFRQFSRGLVAAGAKADSTWTEQLGTARDGESPGCLTVGIEPGSTVGQYRIVRQVGSGAFSRVYEATDTALGRNVAIKFLAPQAVANSPMRQRMLREAHTVAVLDHPGIVPVYGVGNWKGLDYIVSRLVPGETLEQHLGHTRVSPRRAAEISRDIALSLDHAHKLGIVHRDIKPANIMMESGRPLLVDFGLAHFDQEQTQLTLAGDVIGTPAYMPPEQAQGRSFMADGRSDLYSLGVLLYRMLSGQLPFQGTTTEIISQVIHRDPPVPGRIVSGVERDLETIVMKCMEKELSARYATGEMLAADLQRFLDGLPIQARRTGVLGRVARWIRRRPAAAAALVTVGLILSALGGALSQLQSVRHERDRAVSAEAEANQARAETRTLLSLTAASAGQLAMQRGRWQAALEHFDQAIREQQSPGTGSIAWQRLSTLVSLRRIDQARAAFDGMGSSRNLAEDEAVRLYWQAELEVESDPTGGDCERLFEQAIRAGLNPADRHYASGMLATHSEQAAEEFRASLLVDPFHHRARRELVLLLITLARLDEAMDEARVAAQMFPEDPDFGLFQSLVLALQGDLEGATECLPADMIGAGETGRWKSALGFIHNIPQNLQVFPDAVGFDSSQLTETSRRLSGEIVPLFAARGWVFPPRIARLFNDLPVLLSEYSQDSPEMPVSERGLRLADRLGQLSEIHPEATLLMLRSYVDFRNLEIEEQDIQGLTEAQTVGLERMRDSYKLCLERRFLLDYGREDVWRAIYLSSMLLAEYAHHDVERNRRVFVEAVGHIEPSDSTPVAHLRAYVITLLNAEASSEAERWAEQWVRSTNRKDFDAFWHLMIVAQRQQDWLKLERLGREGRKLFPENVDLANFHESAVKRLREIVGDAGGDENEPGARVDADKSDD